jgi:hypothetical protein
MGEETMKKILITAIAAMMIAGTPTAVSAQTPTTITLIQGIRTPPNVDVQVDRSTVPGSTNLAQGSVIDATNYAGLQFELEVFRTGTTDSVMALESVSAPASGNNSVVLTTAGVMTFANNMSEVVDGNARVTLRNASTDVNSINLVGTSQPINDVRNGGEGSIDQASGQLTGARIIDAAGDPLVDVVSTNLALGTNTILYLIGDATAGYAVVQQVIELPIASTDTTTTTTIADGSTTSTTSTSSTSSTSTTSTAVPVAVNTGSPIDGGNSTLWILVLVGGVAIAGGAYLVRRKV